MFRLFLSALFWTLLMVPGNVSALSCEAASFSSGAYVTPQSRFSFLDKVHIKVFCRDLSPGSHAVTVDWLDPYQEIVRQDSQSMDLQQKGNRSLFFWIKLVKKGAMARMFSGSDFNPKFIGQWTARVYFDDQVVSLVQFNFEPL
ncbi:MAG: hypothetical protein ABFS19_02535 [Thermodesulfobacteriota bacterium]